MFFRHLDKDYLHEQYIVLGKSMAQIARERGCARSTVAVTLVNLGFRIGTRKHFRCCKGQMPFGFRTVHGNLVTREVESAVIKQMTAMRNSGASFGQIATWLNLEKVPTKNRVGRWDRPTVYKILKARSRGPRTAI